MVYAFCKKCGEKRELRGGLCEDCQSIRDAERMKGILGEREHKTKEEVEQEIAEKKKDRKFWWGTRE
ncbi:hypothetical protein KKE06_00640 [Candidatus Micrarchaeota archaeon]|nr:hypothetical protein [Candidatus Micrarchaeota archaeon]MBU1930310.1 hypothetical protein [Candidatus Micrarchaeota archaeon]